jgi:Family of unknown function (DUF6464)
MLFIGDSRCKYNALSKDLRCAINPYGPCEGCQYFEPVRERINFIGKPIAPLTRRDILVHNLKAKILEIWSFARYPVGMLQVICALTVLGLLISNKYPISKEHILELFKFNIRIVVYSCSVLRMYNVVINLDGRHPTFLNAYFRIVQPLAWLIIFDTTATLLLKSPIH